MRAEIFASECCGAVFAAGFGPDNFLGAEGDEFYDAIREGACPSCGAMRPGMMEIFSGFDPDPGMNGDTDWTGGSDAKM